MSDHERYREWAGAYVLDALESDERRRFKLHMETCAACQAEVASLAPLTGMLSRVDLAELEPAPATIADRAVEKVRSEWRGLRISRMRWRVATAGVAAAAMFTVFAALPNSIGGSGVALAFETGSQATGEIVVDERGWGTLVEISLDGVPDRAQYVAWAVSESGERHAVATWGPTANGSMDLTGASSLFPAELAEIVVTSSEFEDRLIVARPAV